MRASAAPFISVTSMPAAARAPTDSARRFSSRCSLNVHTIARRPTRVRTVAGTLESGSFAIRSLRIVIEFSTSAVAIIRSQFTNERAPGFAQSQFSGGTAPIRKKSEAAVESETAIVKAESG